MTDEKRLRMRKYFIIRHPKLDLGSSRSISHE